LQGAAVHPIGYHSNILDPHPQQILSELSGYSYDGSGMAEVESGDSAHYILDDLPQGRAGVIDRCRFFQVIEIVEDYWLSGEVGGQGGQNIGG